jgi:hypothetical protein
VPSNPSSSRAQGDERANAFLAPLLAQAHADPEYLRPPSAHPDGPPPPAFTEERDACVVCLTARPTAGFLHGATVHRACCRECVARFQPGQPCPVCRQEVERVLTGVY